MSIKRYGKSSSALLNQKTSFFEENELHLKNQKRIAAIYTQQPKRTNCKNCNDKLDTASDFTKDGIDYVICNQCQHLNGVHEDTTEFCKALYTEDSGATYATNYSSADLKSYNYRTAGIYLPKAEFLYTSLVANKVNPHDLNFLDFGAGSGYFVAGLKKVGLINVIGTEVSKHQVSFGNAMIGEEALQVHEMENSLRVLGETKAQVVSMIGVLEHLQYPREAMKALMDNDNVQYIYISVPTFSLSVYLEILSTEVFNRQLYGGHTHLYTKKSLEHISNEFGFDIIAEWWFGADVVDIFRHIAVTLEQKGTSSKLQKLWKEDFIPVVDAMQVEMDKQHFGSEVHMLLKKK
jgi:2-polyprenyl-3-methyl-5-hydroxy-6-metoxy-1,4-benzoquinol methylase